MVQLNLPVDICSSWDGLQELWFRNLGTLAPKKPPSYRHRGVAVILHLVCVCLPLAMSTCSPSIQRWGLLLPLSPEPTECSRSDGLTIRSLRLERLVYLDRAIGVTAKAPDSPKPARPRTGEGVQPKTAIIRGLSWKQKNARPACRFMGSNKCLLF